MKHTILCSICNREFETNEEKWEWNETLKGHFLKEQTICPNCLEDRDV